MVAEVVTYQDDVGRWHWRLVENGRTVEASGSEFATEQGARDIAQMHAINRHAEERRKALEQAVTDTEAREALTSALRTAAAQLDLAGFPLNAANARATLDRFGQGKQEQAA